MLLAIDPGNIESAYVWTTDDLRPMEFGKIYNKNILEVIDACIVMRKTPYVAIEMVASYGMAVGKDVFETCVWIGRFTERVKASLGVEPVPIYRKDEKMALCGSMKAKDSNIRQALIDRFGVVGTKKNPGWFYGFSGDVWQAYAVAVTYHDLYLQNTDPSHYFAEGSGVRL